MCRQSGFYLKTRSTFLLGAAEIFAVASFAVRHLGELTRRGPDQHFPVPLWTGIAIFSLAAVFFLFDRAATGLARNFCLTREFVMTKLCVTLTPLLLLWLDFIQHQFVLRDISLKLLLLAAAGTLYLQAVFYLKILRRQPLRQRPTELQIRPKKGQKRRAFLGVFLASFSAYSFILLSGILPSLPFTGDEPHYLLTTKSMVRDHDIDLYNNYLHKDYWEFYPGEISWHAYPGKKGPLHIYSKHFPGISLLLVPAYWCGDYLGKILKIPGINKPNERNIRILLARETMVLLASLLTAFFFLLVWEFTQNRRMAFYSWLFFAFTPPLLFYSRLLYSEIPVALLLLLVLRQALFQGPLSKKSLFWSGLGIAVIPWFGIKYVILAAASFVIFICSQWRTIFSQQRKYLYFLGPLLVSAMLFLAFLWHIYGTISPIAVYFGTAAATATPFHFSLKFGQVNFGARALAYFFDQRMGLFVYSPLYILFIPGFVLTFKRSKKIGSAALFLAAAYWVFSTTAMAQGGYAPPERTLLPIVSILALFVSATLSWAKNRSAIPLFRILAIIAILMALLAIAQPRLFFHDGLSDDSWNMDTQSKLLLFLSNVGIDFTRLVPNLVSGPDFSWLILLSWLTLIAGISLTILKKERNKVPPTVRLHRHAIWIILLSFLLAAHSLFSVRFDEQNCLPVPGATVHFQDINSLKHEADGFWTRGNCRTEVVLRTSIPVRRLQLEMTSRSPLQVAMQIGSQRMEYKPRSRDPFSSASVITMPGTIPWKGDFLYLIRFEIRGGFVPQKLEPSDSDKRFLGVFVRLFPVFH
ncbi:MAG: hypothetical protein JXI33_01885 [Candidatus Aminicenantes bacterium]|nr:hypothetical protein [Candidatus Aminicenantes bacterium]